MTALETYLRELHSTRALGAGVDEKSYYAPLANLLNELGKHLKPKVVCVMELQNLGPGNPDGGLYSADQFPNHSPVKPVQGQMPSRGAIEVKPAKEDAWRTADSDQVTGYWKKYRQVLVTNYRDFILVAQDNEGKAVKLEVFSLAPDEKSFWATAPRTLDQELGVRFVEFLRRVMLHAAQLAAPEDVAWFLASYAREALRRVEKVELPALSEVRPALEEALGLKFQGPKGEHFFRSSLVQTLFYGVFSAFVLWAKKNAPGSKARFNWWETARYLRVPMISKLFYLIADPSQLENMNLTEVLDRAGQVLNRVDRASFFGKFQETHAVQYFYEPFLEAFDPELRKELGVWYTPPEIVQYMVERVDRVLRTELNVPSGLADKNVYVLDPCCGTGSYLVEVLNRIHRTLKERGEDALLASDLKDAAQNRVFGFEILPAPFVVSHLQLGLLLQNLGAPLSEKSRERAAVYLTNALTGWEPPKGPKKKLLFPEMEEERDAAEHVKREVPILVILGNPPYNSFAGIAAMEEERDLTEAYRTTKHAPAPQGQGLNDLYIRFYRMAERRIVEQTGRGVVCLISNYSWLDGLSFTGMREKYLEVFDRIWIDCLNGDKYKTGKLTPEGEPDPSVFSTEFNREGIQVGTAIALLVRQDVGARHGVPLQVRFRHLWGKKKRQQLLESVDHDGESPYEKIESPLGLGLPFMPAQVGMGYASWPLLTELFPVSFPGVKTSRDLDLVEIELQRLERRMSAYFDNDLSDHEVTEVAPSIMTPSARYDPKATRQSLLEKGIKSGHFVRYSYRPFDLRWVYWHKETKLLDEKREELFDRLVAGNVFLTSRQKGERQVEGTPFFVTRNLADWHLTRPGSNCFPLTCAGRSPRPQGQLREETSTAPPAPANLSDWVRAYLATFGIDNPDADAETAGVIWMHALAIGYSPAYLSENADGIRQDWPRIPLPDSKELLLASAELGKQIAALLDTETPFDVGAQTCAPLQSIAVLTLAEKRPLREKDEGDPPSDLSLTAGWGHAGKGGVTMPGKGKIAERDYAPGEIESAVGARHGVPLLGDRTLDVYLNEAAYWKNIPLRVWEYTIGGYQVIKKWLSYRERKLLGRALTKDEARYVSEMARRIAAIILLEPALDANYLKIKERTYPWPRDRN